MTVDVSQLVALAADLTQASVLAQVRANAVVKKVAFDIEGTAKQLAPVDTGNLRGSIFTTLNHGSKFISATIGPSAHYGGYVEFGTSRMSPQPYMGPALSRHQPSFYAAMEQLGGQIL